MKYVEDVRDYHTWVIIPNDNDSVGLHNYICDHCGLQLATVMQLSYSKPGSRGECKFGANSVRRGFSPTRSLTRK